MMTMKMIPHSRPSLDDSDIEAVTSVMRSGQLSQGPKVKEFEMKLASYIGKNQAVATSSGSAALFLTLLAMGIKENDEVIIPSFVCSAVLHSVHFVRATPVIVDIQPYDYNISVESVKESITSRTKAIVVPHMFGCPAEIQEMTELGIPVIEDCAQAIGATLNGRRVGSFGHASVFSFYATKVITCGEGGMVLSDSEDLISKIRDLREYDNKDDGKPRFNYKMTDIQATLGLNQLSLLEKFIEKRREIVSFYFQRFTNCDFSLPLWREPNEHVYFRFVVKSQNNVSGYLEKMKQKNVICRRPVYLPLHRYLNLSGFSHTADAWLKSISIPLYPSLEEEEIERIIEAVKEIF